MSPNQKDVEGRIGTRLRPWLIGRLEKRESPSEKEWAELYGRGTVRSKQRYGTVRQHSHERINLLPFSTCLEQGKAFQKKNVHSKKNHHVASSHTDALFSCARKCRVIYMYTPSRLTRVEVGDAEEFF